MPVVGFLHTSPVHEPTFEVLLGEADGETAVVGVVDASLLDRARSVGPDHPSVLADVRRHIADLVAAGCSRIVCTCSTIGGVAEEVGRDLDVTVMRVDRPMAEAAVAFGRPLIVLAALESTVAPTLDLIAELAAASTSGAVPAVRTVVVDGAWARFEAGDLDGYHSLVVDAIGRVDDEGAVIVLAQASMAAAADLAPTDTPVLASPRLAVERLFT